MLDVFVEPVASEVESVHVGQASTRTEETFAIFIADVLDQTIYDLVLHHMKSGGTLVGMAETKSCGGERRH